jgi:branched-chain amino acid transport system substrate-binding protein
VNNSRQLWQGDVNWRTATAYDATQALIAGIKGESSREGVQQALRSSDFSVPGATNPVRFLPSGDRNQSVQLVVVKPGSRSSFGVDFVPISR